MARWGKSLWVMGLGAVLGTGGMAAAAVQPRTSETAPTHARSVNDAKSQFLSRVTFYGDLANEMSRLADQNSQNAKVKELAAQMKKAHHEANGRVTDYVLTRHLNLPPNRLDDAEKGRALAAMAQVQSLENLQGAEFDRAFAQAAQIVPSVAARELLAARDQFKSDNEIIAVVDPLLGALDQQRQAAEALIRDTGSSSARRPPTTR